MAAHSDGEGACFVGIEREGSIIEGERENVGIERWELLSRSGGGSECGSCLCR